ncbi:MAG: hypothetical protein ACI8SJ_000137 [Shewanella sp.]|jgi:hypothetical protein
MIDQKDRLVNLIDEEKERFLNKPLECDGGKTVILRLLRLFNLRNRVELSSLIGVSTGSIATWQTRNTVPFELLIRIHLATGVDLDFLLFGKNEEKQNVLMFCSPPNQVPDFATINQNLKNFRFSIAQPPNYDGGRIIVDRLITLLNLKSRVEFRQLTTVSEGSIATWQTRNITPFELLARVHLATGVPMLFLCFGKHEYPVRKTIKLGESKAAQMQNSALSADINELEKISIDHGERKHLGYYKVSHDFIQDCGLKLGTDFVVKTESATYFINSEIKTVTKGQYLFAINDSYQLGELRQLPDGNIYLIDGQDKYLFNTDTTKIHGKVVSILQSV